jgi:MFS family permease
VVVLVLVMAGACVAQAFGRFTYGVVLPAVRDDLLGGSNGAAGLIGTVNVTAYLAGTLAVAAAASRLSLVGLVRVGLVLSTGGLLAASAAPNGAVLALAVAAMGLGGAAIWIPSPRLAAAAVPPERRGLAAGLVGMGIGAGLVFAGRLSDLVRHDQGDEAWRDVYRIEGLIGMVVLVAALVLLRDRAMPPQGHRPPVAGPVSGAGFGGFGALRRIEGWGALTVAYATFGFMYLLVFAFLVARLEDDAGFSADRASSMFALTGLAAIFGGVVLGPLSDRFGRRRVMVGAFVLFGACTAVILTGTQPWVAIGAFGVGLAFSGLPAVIAAYVVDATDAATYGPAYAAATLAFGLAQAASPQVGGLLADWTGSFTVVFWLSAALALVGAAVSARLPPRRRPPAIQPEPVR